MVPVTLPVALPAATAGLYIIAARTCAGGMPAQILTEVNERVGFAVAEGR